MFASFLIVQIRLPFLDTNVFSDYLNRGITRINFSPTCLLGLGGTSFTGSVLCKYLVSLSPRIPDKINIEFSDPINIEQWTKDVVQWASRDAGLRYHISDEIDHRGVLRPRALHRLVSSRPAPDEMASLIAKWHLTPRILSKYKSDIGLACEATRRGGILITNDMMFVSRCYHVLKVVGIHILPGWTVTPSEVEFTGILGPLGKK